VQPSHRMSAERDQPGPAEPSSLGERAGHGERAGVGERADAAAESAPGAEPSPREALTAPDAAQVVAIETRIERAMRREHPVVFWGTLLVPVLGWAILLVSAGVLRGKEFVLRILAITLLVEAVVGRFVILGGVEPGGAAAAGGSAAGAGSAAVGGAGDGIMLLSRIELFWLVAWIDLCVAMLFMYHATFIYRIWRIGPWLERVRDSSRAIVSRRPWLARFSVLGVIVYVGLPFLGSGAVLGSMLGQLLGLRRLTTLAAVMVGTLAGNTLMLLLAEVIMRVPFLREQHPGAILGGLVVGGLVVLAVQWQVVKRRNAGQAGGAG
jgi:uncharacterized membrane protein